MYPIIYPNIFLCETKLEDVCDFLESSNGNILNYFSLFLWHKNLLKQIFFLEIEDKHFL